MAQIEPEWTAPGDVAGTMPPATGRLMRDTRGGSVERVALAQGQLSARSSQLIQDVVRRLEAETGHLRIQGRVTRLMPAPTPARGAPSRLAQQEEEQQYEQERGGYIAGIVVASLGPAYPCAWDSDE